MTAYEALPLLLRAIGVPDRDTPSDPVARASLYRSLTYARRFLIVLDGARDGEHVRPLLPGGPLCLTLVTSRNRLSELVAREGGTRVSMAPLRPQEAERLIEASIGGEHAAVGAEPVRRLARLCGYLPLALRVATASLTDRPQAPPVAVLARLAAEDRLAELLLTGNAVVAVRAAFDFAYAGLDEPARRLFRRMASAPAPVTAPEAAALAAVPLAVARQRLDTLAAIHLVEATAADTYTVNDLVRLYADRLAPDGPAPAELPRAGHTRRHRAIPHVAAPAR